MQLKFTTLYLLALAAGLSQACHHPRPHDASCSVSFKRGKLSSNGTHIVIQGTTTQSTRCQKKRDELPQSIPGGSVIHIFTKDTVHIKDAQNVTHHGNDCQINVPEYSLPSIEKSETTKLVVPLKKDVVVDCKRRQHKQSGKKHSSTTTTTAATTTKKAKHVPTTTHTTHTTTHTTHSTHTTHTTHSTHTTTTTTEKETTTTHKKPTTTTTKKAKPTHHDDDDDDEDDDDEDDWDYDHGSVTFFTPNQGACGEWNDDNDLIAALGPGLYGDMDEESDLCGKKILIQGPKGNDVTVTVRDACPPCTDSSHVDLSPAAFAKLGDFDTGVLKVKWKFL